MPSPRYNVPPLYSAMSTLRLPNVTAHGNRSTSTEGSGRIAEMLRGSTRQLLQSIRCVARTAFDAALDTQRYGRIELHRDRVITGREYEATVSSVNAWHLSVLSHRARVRRRAEQRISDTCPHCIQCNLWPLEIVARQDLHWLLNRQDAIRFGDHIDFAARFPKVHRCRIHFLATPPGTARGNETDCVLLDNEHSSLAYGSRQDHPRRHTASPITRNAFEPASKKASQAYRQRSGFQPVIPAASVRIRDRASME